MDHSLLKTNEDSHTETTVGFQMPTHNGNKQNKSTSHDPGAVNRYIVLVDKRRTKNNIKITARSLLATTGINTKIKEFFDFIDGFVVDLSAEQAELLQADLRITSIEKDERTPHLPIPLDPQLESPERIKAKIFFNERWKTEKDLQSRTALTFRKLDIDASAIKILKKENGFVAKLTKKEIQKLDSLKRIRSIKHRPFSIDDTEEKDLTGAFSFETPKEIDGAGNVGLPVLLPDRRKDGDSSIDTQEPTTFHNGNSQNSINTFVLPIYSDEEASTGDILPYGIISTWGGKDYSTNGDFAKDSYAFVVDTGVSATTGDLNLNRAWSRSWINGKDPLTDVNGHGSHIAGTIAALANGKGVVGVAPGAEVISLKVLNDAGSGSWSSILGAIDHAINVIESNGIDKSKAVLNMSLGGRYSSSIDTAVKRAADLGIRFAIAAGNSAADADQFSPAAAGDHINVNTVSAVDNTYQMASFSNWDDPFGGDDIDFAAPGVGIKSYYRNDELTTLSGTSMAAPHVAGLMLLESGFKAGPMVKPNAGGYADPFAIVIDFGRTTVESEGAIELQVDSNNKAWINNGSELFPIKRNGWGGQVTQDRGDWTLRAAETIHGTNYVVDASLERVYVWEMDHNWTFLRDSQTATPGSSAFNTIESDFNIDFNDDGLIGVPTRTTVESEGAIELQVDSNNKAWINNGSELFPIKRNGWGGQVTQDRGDWTLRAAETIHGTNYVVDASLERVYVWEMDHNWTFLRDSQTATPGSSAFNTIESDFNIDFNDDGLIDTNI